MKFDNYEKYRSHLKHLLFKDAMMMHFNGCNHNAGDRSVVREIFQDDIKSPMFDEFYEMKKLKYEEFRNNFEPNPVWVQEVPMKDGRWMTEEEIAQYTCEEFHALELDDIISTGSQEFRGGYYDSLEDIDEYVASYTTDEHLNYLLGLNHAKDN